MGDFLMESLTEASTPLIVYPGWGFENQETLLQTHQRAQSGKKYSYQWGSYSRFKVPLSYIKGGERSQIINWWKEQTPLAFTLDSSVFPTTYLCKISNDTHPLGRFNSPYRDLYEGILELETYQNPEPMPRPFILDDPLFGFLDQNYNALIG